MKTSNKLLITALFISCFVGVSFSQSDSSKTVKPKNIEGNMGVLKSNNQLKLSSEKSKSNSASNLNLNIDKKLNTEAIDKNLKLNKSTAENQNFLMETLPEDNDIIGKKYWKGKDVTHKRLESTYSLGTIRSSTRTVRIETRDHSYIDGDRIKIYLNEKVVSTNVGLKGSYYVIYLNLEQGYNRIDFQALNQGFSGPNTAEFKVYDANGVLLSAKDWNLTTGQTATMGIIKN